MDPTESSLAVRRFHNNRSRQLRVQSFGITRASFMVDLLAVTATFSSAVHRFVFIRASVLYQMAQ